MRFMGTLRMGPNGWWTIQADNGDAIELACGMMACFYVNGSWQESAIEYSSKRGYYATNPKVTLVEGLRAGSKVW